MYLWESGRDYVHVSTGAHRGQKAKALDLARAGVTDGCDGTECVPGTELQSSSSLVYILNPSAP